MTEKLVPQNSSQTNTQYAGNVIRYIAAPHVEKLDDTGHKNIVEKCVHFEIHGCLCQDIDDVAIEMGMVADGADRSAVKVLNHHILSWALGEHPSKEQARDAVNMYLTHLGYDVETCQFAWGIHANTDNWHVHILVNRQDPIKGKLVAEGDGWNKRESAKAIAKIEHKYGWKSAPRAQFKIDEKGQLVSRFKRRKIDIISNPARGFELRSGQKSIERLTKESCKLVLDTLATIAPEKRNWADIHHVFAQVGVEFKKSEDKEGAVLTLDGKTWFGAGKIDPALSMNAMVEYMGGTKFRAPRARQEKELTEMREQARKKLLTTPKTLPLDLMSAGHKKRYLDDWGRYKLRQQYNDFRQHARKFSAPKQQHTAQAPR